MYNYDQLWNFMCSLYKIAEQHNTKIYHGDPQAFFGDNSTSFEVMKNGKTKIVLNPDDHDRRCLVLFAHELGHLIDYKENYKTYRKWIEKHDDSIHVYESEKKAWEIAEELLKNIGYEDWKYFKNIRTRCLNTYAPKLVK